VSGAKAPFSGPPVNPYECMHQEWVPVTTIAELAEGVTPENYKQYMQFKPLMKCKHCTNQLSWATFTKRTKHTFLTCEEFERKPELQRADLQADVRKLQTAQEAKTKVC
jgi:hypothetical protein